MASKNQQDTESNSQYQPLASPKRILETIYGSKVRRKSKQLTPLNTSANTKNSNIFTNSSDYYTFQRSLVGGKINKQTNPQKIIQKVHKTFSLSRTSNSKIIPVSNSKKKLNNPSPISPKLTLSQNNNLSSTNKIPMNNTTTVFNKPNKSQNPILKSNMMNSTAYNFRPPTNSYMRKCNNESEQNHNNYLTKYQIIKQLGKGTYGVVYLARKKGDKTKIPIKIQHLQDSFLLAYGSITKCIQRQTKSIQRQTDNHLQASSDNFQQKKLHESVSTQKIQHNQQHKKKQLSPESKLSNIQIKVSQENILPPIRIQSPILKNEQTKEQKNNLEKKNEEFDPNQQLFAIKIYQKFKMTKDPTKFKNIRKEINVMQNIQHPHIIKLYESVQTLTKISLVVEYGGKQSLLDYLKDNYPLSQTIMRKIGNQLISALVYLHEKNIVHRDIKLQNILMHNQNIKIIDFGFSTLTYKNRKLNAICGTPNYMAPEVLSKKEYIGELADVWSFGVVMFTIAQGRHPFKAETYNQLQRIVNKCNYQFKRITNPVHQSFIKRILKVKPQDRPRAIDLVNHPWLIMQQSQSS